jgi:F-type H+-transporting ATPase subunit a
VNPMEQFTVRPLIPMHLFGYDVSFTNQSLFMVIVVAAATLFLTFAVNPSRLVPTRGQSMAELSYEFVAEMMHTTTGEDGLRFFPFVFSLFMFVLLSNFLGLLPFAFTVTSQIAVTFSLALLIILVVIATGLRQHGYRFYKLFVPDVPWYLLLLLCPIEVLSFLIRPISLSVRLFANMLAGHTMLAVFAGFIIALGGAGGILAYISFTPMLLIVAIQLLELLVSFLQAYVFAMLTCIYLNEALHLHDNH